MIPLIIAAIIFGIGYAVLAVGPTRIFWALIGYKLGQRKAKR